LLLNFSRSTPAGPLNDAHSAGLFLGCDMSGWLILVVSAIYAYAAVEQCWKNNPWLGLAFFCYAISNVAMYQLSSK